MLKTVIRTVAPAAMSTLLVVACGGGDSPVTNADAATAQVQARGLSSLKFDKDQYTASAGDVTIGLFNDDSQVHDLLIDGQSGFKLEVKKRGDSDAGKVSLTEGTYTLYCDVPTHRESGMESKLVVSPAAPSSGAPSSASASPN